MATCDSNLYTQEITTTRIYDHCICEGISSDSVRNYKFAGETTQEMDVSYDDDHLLEVG